MQNNALARQWDTVTVWSQTISFSYIHRGETKQAFEPGCSKCFRKECRHGQRNKMHGLSILYTGISKCTGTRALSKRFWTPAGLCKSCIYIINRYWMGPDCTPCSSSSISQAGSCKQHCRAWLWGSCLSSGCARSTSPSPFLHCHRKWDWVKKGPEAERYQTEIQRSKAI